MGKIILTYYSISHDNALKVKILEDPAALLISPVDSRHCTDVSTNILQSMPTRRFWHRVFRLGRISIGRELIRIHRLRRTIVPCPSRRNRRRAAIFRAIIQRRRQLMEPAPLDNGHDPDEEEWDSSDQNSGESQHEELVNEEFGIEQDEGDYLHSPDYGDSDEEDRDGSDASHGATNQVYLDSEDDSYFSDENSDSNSDNSSDDTDMDFETMCHLYGITPPSPLFIPFMAPVIPLREHLRVQDQLAAQLHNDSVSPEGANAPADIDVDHLDAI
ncbi:hypothetical protein VNI00_012078 [Paramarasmius palmivorus]|uniref:Uncharacterized protein n=1 Tax=Paramarasmius palmivorus TaxID=297713 RepID=A0AAW0C8C8_9AGAR